MLHKHNNQVQRIDNNHSVRLQVRDAFVAKRHPNPDACNAKEQCVTQQMRRMHAERPQHHNNGRNAADYECGCAQQLGVHELRVAGRIGEHREQIGRAIAEGQQRDAGQVFAEAEQVGDGGEGGTETAVKTSQRISKVVLHSGHLTMCPPLCPEL